MLPCVSKATSVGRPKVPPRPAPAPGLASRPRSVCARPRGTLEVIDRFVLAAEHQGDQPLRVELHHHVRAFVDHPDVVFLVDADGVREGEAVGVLAPFLDELAGLVELEELRRLRAARRAGVAAARVDEQVLLRVDGDAFGFADGVAGRHQRQRYRVVRESAACSFRARPGRRGGLLLGAEAAPAAAARRRLAGSAPRPAGACAGSPPRCA